MKTFSTTRGKAGQRRRHYRPKEMPLRIRRDRLFHLYIRAASASVSFVICLSCLDCVK